MAQLVDGLPTRDEAWDIQGHLIGRGHPILQHLEICPGALEKTKRFRDAFEPVSLMFNPQTLQAYQDASPGSSAFNMRLFELIAVSIHQIAVFLFKLEPKLHVKDEIQATVNWEPPPIYDEAEEPRHLLDTAPIRSRPTLFYHVFYLDHDQYPDGIADIAGYWAEDRILGGIILFNRGESGNECKNIYFHAGRYEETFRIWKPLDVQVNAMVDFLLAENTSDISQPPFPMLAKKLNLERYDPWDAMAFHHIFRDPWERRIPDEKPEERDVRTVTDYPEVDDLFRKVQEAAESATGREWELPLTEGHGPQLFPVNGYQTPELCPGSRRSGDSYSLYSHSPDSQGSRYGRSSVDNTGVDNPGTSENQTDGAV